MYERDKSLISNKRKNKFNLKKISFSLIAFTFICLAFIFIYSSVGSNKNKLNSFAGEEEEEWNWKPAGDKIKTKWAEKLDRN